MPYLYKLLMLFFFQNLLGKRKILECANSFFFHRGNYNNKNFILKAFYLKNYAKKMSQVYIFGLSYDLIGLIDL